MIAAIFHEGSGLGNQLHRYVMARVLALDNDWQFGMYNPGLFKGSTFIHLDMGQSVSGIEHRYTEKKTLNAEGVDVRTYDWLGIKSLEDNTVIDGEFQGEKYFEHRKDQIREWLSVGKLKLSKNLCIINFRGGEYVHFKDLFLPHLYWDMAIARMKNINPDMHFEVVTDDIPTASLFFPDFEISHDLSRDWRAIRYAHYLILSNSSFAILPAWLNENAQEIIAPKYWARHNKGYWALPYNNYKGWTYI